MVNSKEAMESQFVTADIVNKSKTKKLVVVDPGDYEDTNYGKKLTLGVNIDGKKKIWRPNKDTVSNLQILGADTVEWVGKPITLTVEKRSGKDAVIGIVESEQKPQAS